MITDEKGEETTIPRRVRIESDGTVVGTSVIDADTGHEILCTRAEILIDPAECVVKAVITFAASPLKIECDAEFIPAANAPIDALELTTQFRNALMRSGIRTVQELIDYQQRYDIRSARGIGALGKAVIEKALKEKGYTQ